MTSASEQTSASKRDDEFFEAFRRLLWSYREIMSKHGYDLDRPSVSEAEAALSKFTGQPYELSKAQARIAELEAALDAIIQSDLCGEIYDGGSVVGTKELNQAKIALNGKA